MVISKVEFCNYGVYKGLNHIDFAPTVDKNVFVISGENGFGKTTFLTGLVWCLYGKLMADVDEKYKREIYEAGGYKKYAAKRLNRTISNKTSYYVSLTLSDVYIPSVPCENIKITRRFDLVKNNDRLEILIDGQENELTKSVGLEIFIHDFILPKEIAKFFFFDAEKIVSLAEMKSIEDKKNLGKAYSEVLGIKKYVDLKNNLQDLRLRLKRNSASLREQQKFVDLKERLDKLQSRMEFNLEQVEMLLEEKETKKRQSEQFQEKLIREGNSLSVEELIDLKKLRERLTEERKTIRNQLKDLLELAPFAIAGAKLKETHQQANREALSKSGRINPDILTDKARRIVDRFKKLGFDDADLSINDREELIQGLQKAIVDEFAGDKEDFKVLLDFSEAEYREFNAIWDNLTLSYNTAFKNLITEDRNNRLAFNKVIRKISNAESKENDLLVKEIRREKNMVDKRILEIDEKMATIHQDIGSKQRELTVISRQVSELAKKIELEESDRKKDELAKRQMENLERFLVRLKNDKKSTLEQRIKDGLNRLMHKTDFVNQVEVEIQDEIIDINLYDKSKEIISKESLSKGEQQLYATSILKALVDESNIKFPIFIDSPLQKFDKKHSNNIIKDFYPNVSEQVVLFPLLEKELNKEEYASLLPNINATFLIKNIGYSHSEFLKIKPSKLFDTYHEHVYTY
ncbi:DNA sulfur modification protein DndD [Croceitalea marina]|uniref:DNA sulfur modification protein DndD n=1 Tax=Croceitalea marina TaxID=1775166 RepID=A0ABW5MUP8_9FLAO